MLQTNSCYAERKFDPLLLMEVGLWTLEECWSVDYNNLVCMLNISLETTVEL
jgi:hypothetical protein